MKVDVTVGGIGSACLAYGVPLEQIVTDEGERNAMLPELLAKRGVWFGAPAVLIRRHAPSLPDVSWGTVTTLALHSR